MWSPPTTAGRSPLRRSRRLLFVVLATVSSSFACDGASPVAAVPPKERDASLSIVVEGLPLGVLADIELRTEQTVQHFPASNTIATLKPGIYTIIVLPVENAIARFGSSLATQQFTLVSGEARTIPVVYVQTTGLLAVGLDGLPTGVSGAIEVTGPAGFTSHLSQADTLRKLTAGTYTVSAAPIAGTLRFVPDSATRTVRVDSARASSVTVRFTPLVSLTIQIDGLPAGVAAAVNVSGQVPSQLLTTTTTLTDLPLGSYIITPSVVTAGEYSYLARAQTVSLTLGGPSVIAVHYVRQDAQIAVRIQNGPVDLRVPNEAIVTIAGPGRSFTLSSDTTLTGLPFGTYRYSVTAPAYKVVAPNRAQYYVRGIVYSSTLEGRTDLSVSLDAAHPSGTVIAPLELVYGAATFYALGAPPPVNLTGGGRVLTSMDINNATGSHGWASDSGVTSFVPPGAYRAGPSMGGIYPDLYWPGDFNSTFTISAAFPLAEVRIPYHRLQWPTLALQNAGMPAGLYATVLVSSEGLGESSSTMLSPNSITRSNLTFPTLHRLEVLMPVMSGDTAAWEASPKFIDFTLREGQTSTVTVQMRPTNILKIVVSGNPFPVTWIRGGQMTVTFPDGQVLDLSQMSSNGADIVMPGRPVGTYLFRANPVQVSGVNFVADAPVQAVVLPQQGRVIVTIHYTQQ